MIRTRQLTRRFGRRTAVDHVDLDIDGPGVVGLLGPNGAGKTTLIKILLGIVRRTSGVASVLGQRAGQISARRRMGYLPENHRIPRHLTGRTALEYYGCLSGLSVAEVRRRTPELIDRVGLKGRDRERVSGYSKGMQQRLGLAQAMLHNPDLIILDEPTDGVDPVGRKEIREVLKGLAADGATIFLNSHLLQEIELICEQVAILSNGTVRKTGSVKELTAAISESPLLLQVAGPAATVKQLLPEAIDRSNGVFDVELSLPSQAEVDRTIDELRAAGISIVSMRRRSQTLEEAFLEIVSNEEDAA